MTGGSYAVHPVLEAIVLKALRKAPEHRYQTAGELARDLDAYLKNRPTSVEGIAQLPGRRCGRLRRSAILGVLASGLAVICARYSSPTMTIPFDAAQRNSPSVAPKEQLPGGAGRSTFDVPSEVIDLLAIVSIPDDVDHGNWIRTPNGVRSDRTDGAKLYLPHEPSGAYDFRVRFVRAEGDGIVSLIFRVDQVRCLWFVVMPGGKSHITRQVNGRPVYVDDETHRLLGEFENGREYTATLKVRDGSVSAFLDEALVVEWRVDHDQLRLSEGARSGINRLGLMSQSPTEFLEAEVRIFDASRP